jgi:hypothetical protein
MLCIAHGKQQMGGSDDAVHSISESQGNEKVFSYLFGIVNK